MQLEVGGPGHQPPGRGVLAFASLSLWTVPPVDVPGPPLLSVVSCDDLHFDLVARDRHLRHETQQFSQLLFVSDSAPAIARPFADETAGGRVEESYAVLSGVPKCVRSDLIGGENRIARTPAVRVELAIR